MKPTNLLAALRHAAFLLLSTAAAALLLAPPSAAGAPFTFSGTGSLNTARTGHTATLLPNGKVLVTGGVNVLEGAVVEDIKAATAELYDPTTGTWAPTGSMAQKRASHTATLLGNGSVLVTGGDGALINGGVIYGGSSELYDPASGTWSATGTLITGRYSQMAILLPNGKVLVAGGNNEIGAALASAELYDPATGHWTATTNTLTVPRAFPTAAALPNGKILVTGGSGDTSVELYDQTTGLWAATGSVSVTDNGALLTPALLTPLLTGKLLFVGSSFLGLPCDAELYDQASGTWVPTGSAPQRPYNPTATLLPNGQVLLAGVFPELYDPASGTWSPTGRPVGERWYHTATLLPDGRVLLVGGFGVDFDGQVVSLATAELYDSGSTPQARTGMIISQVHGLVTAGALTSNQGAALTDKLDGVVSKLSKGQNGAAGNQLGAFSNQVGAFINSGSLTPAQGQPLINAAAAIRSQIGS